MPVDDFIVQFLKIKERELEEKTWELWLALRPHMDKSNFISYEELLATAKQQEVKPELSDKPVSGVYIDQAFI
jgi:hypothetical protein